jgi:hypothetical protein
MGFKKQNYTIKKTMVTLPEAYAIIKNIYIAGQHGTADFVIQSSRDNSMFLQPLDIVRVNFEVNRNESPYITAYRKAKESTEEVFYKNGTEGYVKNIKLGAFHDWEDDNQNG